MNFEALRKEAESRWGIPVSRETVECLWGRFRVSYGLSDKHAERDKDMFFEDYGDYAKVYTELAALNGPPGQVQREHGKRGPYKKRFLRSLEVVSLIGRFRMTQDPGTRVPWGRLSEEWNKAHPRHKLSREAMRQAYIRKHRECCSFVVSGVIEKTEAWLKTAQPKEAAVSALATLEELRDVVRNPDAYRVDVYITSEGMWGIRTDPVHLYTTSEHVWGIRTDQAHP